MGGRRRSRASWVRLVREFGGSDLTHREFCARAGVDRGTFRKWRRVVEAEAGPQVEGTGGGTLVRVELDGWGSGPMGVGSVRTLGVGVGPAELRFEEGTQAGYVGSVVAAIARALGRC